MMDLESCEDGGDDQLYEMMYTSVKTEVAELNLDSCNREDITDDPFFTNDDNHGANTVAEQTQRNVRKRQKEQNAVIGPVRKSPRRASPRVSIQPPIKDEPQSAEEDSDDFADQDYKLDDSDEDLKIKRSTKKPVQRRRRRRKSSVTRRQERKKKASEMTEEERLKNQEKRRAEARARWARKRAVKTEVEVEDLDGQEKKNKKRERGRATKRKSLESSSCSTYTARRKKMENMTEEEREAFRAKWREEARQRRAKKRAAMTPEQREEFLRDQREKKQVLRALERESMTEAEREESLRKIRERRAKLTPEQKNERYQRTVLRNIEKRAAMTEEEKEMVRMNKYFQRMAKMGEMTAEEKEEKRLFRIEYLKKVKEDPERWKRYKERSKMDQLKRQQKVAEWKKDAKGREEYRELCRRYKQKQKERIAELKKDSVKWEEYQQMRKNWKQNQKAKLAEMKNDPVKWEEYQQKRKRWQENRRARNAEKRKDPSKLNELEKKRKSYPSYRLKREKATKKKRRKENSEKSTEKKMPSKDARRLKEIKKEMTNPEVRERELIRQRICWAKRNLKKRLEAQGVSPEEIKKRVDELEHTYQPQRQFRQYKPRPETLEKLIEADPTLSEEIQKNIPNISAATFPIPSSSSAPPKQTQTRKSTKQTTENQEMLSENFQQNSPTSNFSDTTSQVHFPPAPVTVEYPPHVPSPAGDSSCSYVSVTETQKAVDYTTSQPSHHNLNTNQYSQQYNYQVPVYSHQQSAAASSLQHLLDSITYQESGTTTGPQDNYASSCDDDNHYAPESPGGANNDDDEDYSFDQPAAPSSSTKRSWSHAQNRRRRHVPMCTYKSTDNKRKSKTPKTICDECGVAFAFIAVHKVQFHNPNYKDRRCQVCGEEFTVAKEWYAHYNKMHRTPEKKESPFVCELCGDRFRKKLGLDKHKYYRHGDGLKKENWHRCSICPEERSFKSLAAFNRHLKNEHPDFEIDARRGEACYRCTKRFREKEVLRLHVEEKHPDSHFPCEHCNECRFTQLGLDFHYTKCTKIERKTKYKMKQAEGMAELNREHLPCELCGTLCSVMNLTRHYWVMHNVKEDSFKCQECGKSFKKREQLVVHLEERHMKCLEELKDMMMRLNAKNKEGAVIQNTKEPLFQFGLGLGATTERGKAKGGRKTNIRNVIETSEEEEDEEDEEEEESEQEEETVLKGRKRERRRITVVAEEDEEQDLEGCSEYVKEAYWKRGWRKLDGYKDSTEGPKPSAELQDSSDGKRRKNRVDDETREKKRTAYGKAVMDPEVRKRELMRARVNWAKRALRKRLEAEGVPPEEIQKRVDELQHTYQPKKQFLPYKPRS